MTDTPKHLRKINALSQNKNRKHPGDAENQGRHSHDEQKGRLRPMGEWVEKPSYSPLTISAEIHEAVMALPPQERRDRAKVNEAVRDGLKLVPLRPAGSENEDGVTKATE
jgi:hypothetical protein